MRFEIRDREIEMIPETNHDRDVVEKLHRAGGSIRIKDGRTTDRDYPPSSRQTNVVFVFPDPNDWGT